MKRRFRIAVLCVLALLVVSSGALFFVLHSPTAVRMALAQLVARSPVELGVGSVDGTLAGGLRLGDIKVSTESLDIRADGLDIELRLGALLDGELHIAALGLHNLVLSPRAPKVPSAQPPEPLRVAPLPAPLPLTIDALRIDGATLATQPDYPLQQLRAGLAWRDTAITISALAVRAAFATLDGSAHLETAHGGDARLDLEWAFTEPAAAGTLTMQGALDNLAVEHELRAPRRVATRGTVHLAGVSAPVLDLVHECQADCGTPILTARAVRVAHTGTLDDSKLHARAELGHARLPATQVALDGRWRDGVLDVASLTAAGPSLAARGNARVATGEGVDVKLQATVDTVSADVLADGVRGQLGGQVSATYASDQWSVRLTELAGTINDYELRGAARLTGAGADIRVHESTVRLGVNAIKASGHKRGKALAFDARLDLPELAQLDPRLGGSATGALRIAGRVDAPAFDLELEANTLRAGTLALDSLDARVALDASGALNGTVQTQGLRSGEQDFGGAEVVLGGTRQTPSVELAWRSDAPLAGLAVDARVGLAKEQDTWRASVESASLGSEAVGRFTLDAPFAAHFAPATGLAVAPHTWLGNDARVDISELQVAAQQTTLRATLTDLPLATLDPVLPAGVALRGRARANINLSSASGQWQGNLSWAHSDTVLRVRNDTASRRLAFERFAINAVLTEDLARGVIDAVGDNDMHLKLSVAALTPLALRDSPLDGSIDLRLGDLAWLAAFVPGIDELSGQLQLDGQLGGRVDAPLASGEVRLANGTVALRDAGIRLEDIALSGTLDETLRFAGNANSGGGPLNLDGEVSAPFTAARRARLRVTGTDVQVFNDASYKVRASPDIELGYHATDGARVTGRVDIPSAQIRIDARPQSVVSASPDVRVVGRAAPDALALPLAGTVKLVLGDDVTIDALGLDAGVTGQVSVQLAASQPPRLTGRLALQDGTFAAYGQKLKIERGNVIYAGPVDNPSLDVRATRDIDGGAQAVKAGVAVTGTAKQPEVALYSEPAMSETDTLSYLLLGRAADDTSGVDGAVLSQAALSLGMSRSSPLTQQLAAGLGLDELTVGGDSVEAAELVAGKQINDRLYVRYSYGVFSNLGAILLRYRLSQRLVLEAGSADAQSIDVLYTIEK